MNTHVQLRPGVAAVFAAAFLVTAGAVLAVHADASADQRFVRVTGRAPTSSGTAYLEVEVPSKPDASGLPTSLDDRTVDTTQVAGSGDYSLNLPSVAQLGDAVSNGWVNAIVVVVSGDQTTTAATPIMVAKTAGVTGSTSDVVRPGSSVVASPLPPMVSTASTSSAQSTAAPQDNTRCVWSREATEEDGARVGELHIASPSGSEGYFGYHTQADSTFTVGLSTSSGPYHASGSVHVSNSISTDANYGRGANSVTYAVDHMYFGRYHNNGAATCPGYRRKIQAIQSTGDIYVGPKTPPRAPYSSCHAAPHGYTNLETDGVFSRDRAEAHDYDFVAHAFSFDVGGHTGYTEGIHVTLKNESSKRTYMCGDRRMPDPSIIFNKSY